MNRSESGWLLSRQDLRWYSGRSNRSTSQRLGLSAAGARGPTPQVAGTGFYLLEWTSNGPGSNNLEGGTTRGGMARFCLT